MKLNVTHSRRPRAASRRRASAARVWRGVSVAGGTGAARGMETGGHGIQPADAQDLLDEVRLRLDLGHSLDQRDALRRGEPRMKIEHDRRGHVVAPGRHGDAHLLAACAPPP